MKKTAVEWFFYELYSIRITIPFKDQGDAILKAFEQAKAMEKEQIIYAHESGVGCNDYGYGIEYYNETFKSE